MRIVLRKRCPGARHCLWCGYDGIRPRSHFIARQHGYTQGCGLIIGDSFGLSHRGPPRTPPLWQRGRLPVHQIKKGRLTVENILTLVRVNKCVIVLKVVVKTADALLPISVSMASITDSGVLFSRKDCATF